MKAHWLLLAVFSGQILALTEVPCTYRAYPVRGQGIHEGGGGELMAEDNT